MANETRHCAFCDNEVKPLDPEALKTVGRDSSETIYVHVKPINCRAQRLTESQTYTMGDASSDE